MAFVPSGLGVGKRARVAKVEHRRREVVVAVDQSTVVAAGTALLGTMGGIGLLVFTEEQGKRNEQRPNTQRCVECSGVGIVSCNICGGDGRDPVFKNSEEDCPYCEGKGESECTNCTGSGIQPRFLDRLSPEDFMD
mmetsp:Transcript_18651/g.74986  ORF Transcript_18651/g.74986 Transcript_18651/m.74986 type:complete len:136 (-) Transcript_18651:1991-2398(-)|eukprot:CAMPEP_0113970750 /NCGR_PEP_ID=MMETSP0011_2-20120614/11511_1 /TAXON_ID=101924 /ORGANISM="Rhodosorus marinus" /LENGTH=135 /DNA_ID=CAMNT_0000985483 /DNA_START=79 /DNA_END=486 /DNA_ORIENTATION=- /assembly_acc=CAM_ASM_000156